MKLGTIDQRIFDPDLLLERFGGHKITDMPATELFSVLAMAGKLSAVLATEAERRHDVWLSHQLGT